MKPTMFDTLNSRVLHCADRDYILASVPEDGAAPSGFELRVSRRTGDGTMVLGTWRGQSAGMAAMAALERIAEANGWVRMEGDRPALPYEALKALADVMSGALDTIAKAVPESAITEKDPVGIANGVAGYVATLRAECAATFRDSAPKAKLRVVPAKKAAAKKAVAKKSRRQGGGR